MTVKLLVGDVRSRIREIPDGSVDLVACSPPFLALRKYGDDGREMGSERTPADFLDALLELTQEFRRVLAPHGSIAIELGDTYSGSGGGGGDYLPGGLREGQPGFAGSAETQRQATARHWREKNERRDEWPLAKSLTLIPTLYPASLAYGWNMLNPAHTFDRWRVRNVVVWARPNPPVGALGDKVRPATSYITVACTSAKRWFDLDAVRTAYSEGTLRQYKADADAPVDSQRATLSQANNPASKGMTTQMLTHAGAPPLDWWEDDDPTGHATLILPTQPYRGSHYAVWPEALARRLILMLCPQWVCESCGHALESTNEKPSTTPAMRGMRPSYHDSTCPAERPTQDAVLFDLVSQPSIGAHACLDEGMDTRPEGLHPDSRSEQSDGEPRGLRDGAPSRDGAVDRSPADLVGGRASSERREGRQPPGESRPDGQGGSRPSAQREATADHLSTLQWGSSGEREGPRSCPRCGSTSLRPGRVLDSFAGSGTTLAVAQGLGRDATGIELYAHNAELCRQRVGMYLEVVG